MSSRTVEREIVQMEFDARKFSKGIDSAGQDLNSFKKQFDMTYQQKGLLDLEKTADGISFEGMTSGVNQVAASFSALQVIGFTVLNRLTNAALDFGKKLVSVVTVDPLKTGLEEYETQLNAVQTIMANTAKHGTTLDDVNAALDELNEYADLTIYNFTEMTSAIGRFTTAGVELDTSVQAIKGLSNVAALSGANAQEAARGQYQLSQALSSGIIRLQDWMSIENANMGGQVFRDSLIETAKIHGIEVDKMIEKHGSFRLSLQEQWLSSEVMLETLSKFTGELSDQDLEALGYNEEQIASIQQTATLALDAATKIKTVTQLVDVLKEAMQSGWSQSWRTIIGDFEEAKDFWGKIAKAITIPIERSAEERNKQLQFWADSGGRQEIVDALILTLYSGLRVLTAFQEVINEVFGSIKAAQLITFSRRIGELAENFADVTFRLKGFKDTLRGLFGGLKSIGEGVLNVVRALVDGITDVFEPIQGSQIVKMAEGFKALADRFKEGTENLGPFRRIVSGIAAALDIALRFIVAFIGPLGELINHVGKGSEGFWEWLAAIGDSIVAWREMAIETDLFNKTAARVVAFVKDIANRVHLLVDAFLELEIVRDIRDWLSSLTKEDFLNAWNKFLSIVRAIITPIIALARGIKYLFTELGKVEAVENFVNQIKAISWSDLKTGFQDLATSVKEFFDSFRNSENLAKISEFFSELKKNLISDPLSGLAESAGKLTDKLGGLKDIFGGVNKEASTTNSSINKIGEKIKELIPQILDGLVDIAKKVNWTSVINVLTTGILVSFASSLRSSFKRISKGGLFEDLGENLFGKGTFASIKSLTRGLVGTIDELRGVLTAYQSNIKADTLKKIASALLIFAGALLVLTFVDSAKLAAASAVTAAMLATLFGSSAIMSKIRTQDVAKVSTAIIALSLAIAIASVGLQTISGIDEGRIVSSMEAMAAGLTGLVLAVHGLGSGRKSLTAAGTLILIALALQVLADSVVAFGSVDPEILANGIKAIGLSMGILVSSLLIIKKSGESGMLQAAGAISSMAWALKILVGSVREFGKMDPDVLMQGLITVGVTLAGFAAYSRLVKPEGMIKAGIGMVIIAGAMIILANAIRIFSSIDKDSLIQGLIAMGAALLILVVAANLMTGAVAGAAATLIMAVAITVLAVALKAIASLSLEELLIALGGLAGVFIILGVAGLLLAPVVPILLGLGIAMLLIGAAAGLLGLGIFLAATGLVALAASAAAIGAAIGIVGVAIIEILPKLAEAIAQALVNFFTTIAENTPKLVEAFKTIILGMIQGITELIPEIVTAILTMITAILTAIGEAMPDLVQAGFDILLGFIQGIEDNIAEVVETGLGILTEFINGLKEGIPDLVTSAFELILEFLNAVDAAVVQYTEQIVAAGLAIGQHLIEGVASAITNGAGGIKNAVWGLVQSALDALNLGFIIKSPSRATYYAGEKAVQGLLLAFYDGQKAVKDGMLALTEEAKDGLKPLERAMIDAIENDWELSPIITPVVDLDNLSQGAALANALFRDVRLGSSDYDNSNSTGSDISRGDPRNQESGVTYIQNIHSPKALDSATIYRQTRTLVATRSRKAFEK